MRRSMSKMCGAYSGVGDVSFSARLRYSMRIWLIRKAANLGMTPRKSSRNCVNNRQVPADMSAPPIPLGQNFRYPLSAVASGDGEQFNESSSKRQESSSLKSF